MAKHTKVRGELKVKPIDSEVTLFCVERPSGKKLYWMYLHVVEGWPTYVRIAKAMYEQALEEQANDTKTRKTS